jgi:hypothetical protein
MHGVPRTSRMAALLAGVALVLLGLPMGAAAEPPNVAAVPTITVTPDSSLVSRQTVTVSGTGFTPGWTVVVTQCPAGGSGTTACSGTVAEPTTDGSGAFTTTFTVSRGATEEGFPPTPTIDCAAAPGTCAIFAHIPETGDVAVAPISFVPNAPIPTPSVTVTPQFDLPNLANVQVDASGFVPFERVTISQCPASSAFCGAHYSGEGGYTAADGNGEVHATFTVRREIASGSPVVTTNCSSSVGACVLRVFADAEQLSSTDVPIGVDPTAEAPLGTLVVSPAGPWFDGQVVTLSGSGYYMYTALAVAECTAQGTFDGSECSRSLFTPVLADIDGNFTVPFTITRTFESQDTTIDCAIVEGGCVIFVGARYDYPNRRNTIPIVFAPAVRPSFTG